MAPPSPQRRGLRILAAAVATGAAAFVGLAAIAGGLHGDDATDRALTGALAAALALSAALIGFVRGPAGAVALAATLAAWMIWELTSDFASTSWAMWLALAVAAGLAWSTRDATR